MVWNQSFGFRLRSRLRLATCTGYKCVPLKATINLQIDNDSQWHWRYWRMTRKYNRDVQITPIRSPAFSFFRSYIFSTNKLFRLCKTLNFFATFVNAMVSIICGRIILYCLSGLWDSEFLNSISIPILAFPYLQYRKSLAICPIFLPFFSNVESGVS